MLNSDIFDKIEYESYISARDSILLRQRLYFKDYYTNRNEHIADKYYDFILPKNDKLFCFINFTNTKDAVFRLDIPQNFSWNIDIESVCGSIARVYISDFKKKECKLFVLNFSNLTRLKIAMEEAKLTFHKMYKLFCDMTGLGRSQYSSLSTSFSPVNPYSYVCKPLEKIRLIDPEIHTDQILNDRPINFANILNMCIEAVNLKYDGYIFDPLLINDTEDVTDYYVSGWKSEIVLFKPSEFLDSGFKIYLSTSPVEVSTIGSKWLDTVINTFKRKYGKNFDKSMFKLLYNDIVRYFKKFKLKGIEPVSCEEPLFY